MSTILLEEPFLLVVKATLLLSAGGLLTVAARRAPASIRHLVWAATLVGLLVLPVLAVGLPRWTVPVLPAEPAAPVSLVSESASAPSEGAGVTDLAGSVPASASAPAPDAPAGTPVPRAGLHPLLLLWAAGSFAVLGWVLLGQIGVQRLRRRAQPVRNAEWLREAHDLAWLLDIRRPVALLRGVGTATPMTWGILWPTVLLPDEAEEWGEDRRRMVLLHELAHVRRKDCLTQLAAHLACALFWFHPLAWYAARRLRVERERACDDMVVRAGASAPDYADHLLHVARTLKTPRASGMAVAMARPGQLEGRLLAVLDPARRRGTAARTTRAVALAGLAALTVSLAVMHPGEVSAGEFGEEAAGAEQPTVERVAETAVERVAERSKVESEPGGVSTQPELRWTGSVASGRTLAVHGMNGAIRAERAESRTASVAGTREPLRRGQREVRLESVEHAGGVTVCLLPEGARCTAEGIRGGGNQQRGARTAHLTVRVPDGVALRTETMNGALAIDGVRGNVSATTMNGAIEVAAAGNVEAKTMNGAINASMGRADWSGELSLETMNGEVRATLPDDASTEISARTANGRIDSDFPLEIRRRPGSTTATGTIGGGGRSLRITTMNGAVRILRRGGPLPGAVSSGGVEIERSAGAISGFAASMEAFGAAMAELGEEIAEAVARDVEAGFLKGFGSPSPDHPDQPPAPPRP